MKLIRANIGATKMCLYAENLSPTFIVAITSKSLILIDTAMLSNHPQNHRFLPYISYVITGFFSVHPEIDHVVTVVARKSVHRLRILRGIVPPTCTVCTHTMLLRAALLRIPALPRTLLRAMSGAKSYSSSELLVNDPKYSWLRRLGLQEENPGVCDGTWHANGPVRACICACVHLCVRAFVPACICACLLIAECCVAL